jgi:hypothetical protein
MARLASEVHAGAVTERLEAVLHAINDARIEAAALERALPAMVPGERLASERRRRRLQREIATGAAGLRAEGRGCTYWGQTRNLRA